MISIRRREWRSRSRRLWLALAAVGVLAAVPGLASWTTMNHSMDIEFVAGEVCTDGAVFKGRSSDASSLNIVFTGEVWDGTGNTLLATGNTDTFIRVGQARAFIVPATLTAGSTVALVVTNMPGSSSPLGGDEGDTATATVNNCSIAGVPTLPVWGIALLALALLAAGRALVGGTGHLPTAGG